MPEPKLKSKKAGRPKLPKGDAKATMLRVRFNMQDIKSVEKTAKSDKKSVSSLARTLMAPPVSVGDTVLVNGKEGRHVVIAGWPGKPRYFIAPEGSLKMEVNWNVWVDPDTLTLVKKGDPNADFRQVYP